MRIQPYRTLDNVIEGAVLTFVDITTVHKLQEELQVNEERLRVAISSSAITVFNQDLDLRYTWIHNPSFELRAESIIGKTDADLLPAPEAAALTALKQEVLDSGKSLRQNVPMTLQGKTHVYDLAIEPLRDSGNTIVGITCASLAVTGQPERACADSGTNGAATADTSGDNR